MNEQIIKMCRDISAERDPAKVTIMIRQLRKLLAEEEQRIAALIAKNSKSRPEGICD